jgi:two-component system, LytTR family, response regulator
MQVAQASVLTRESDADALLTMDLNAHAAAEAGLSRSGARIRAVIVDDQLLCRETLTRLLRRETDIEVVGMATNGREGVELIQRMAPDLVFLDVEMPELDGFDVLSRIALPQMPAVIFATACENFALKAFEVQASDYLLKPFSSQRLQIALQKVRTELNRPRALPPSSAPGLEVIPSSSARPLERLAVKSNGRILLLRLADVTYISAADNYVELHVGGETHLLRETMAVLESKLPSERFLRISRSTIVNLDHIKELAPLFHGDYEVILRNGVRLNLTRGYREKLAPFSWL